ncbi:PhzF family phenazine biosynthesis protein [Crenobacter sp. SG2305]|uniref:PhzF family phenazine biosynthesis protein n=1 Tax=Crenobacter oryzisoli TaxID=3056844 RepID=UPI0025AA6BDF|nr:PhzF family phenazine biosynthesis protein [Crenobacter sp. SG2305]MDN0084601.1 PhzF family phenazine biosynthesis protein [Crenobacter sp. SG2305]
MFPDASGLDDATMQLIARQFNLSETVFVLPFAGHPRLAVPRRGATNEASLTVSHWRSVPA